MKYEIGDEMRDEIRAQRVLVTGGCGFIGSHITEWLLNNKCRHVRVLDNLCTGHFSNIEHLQKQYPFNLEFVFGDVSKYQDCLDAMNGMTIVCHQAALRSVTQSMDNPLATNNANVTGTLNIFQAAKESGIKRVVYASSSSVYGDVHEFPEREGHESHKVLSPYAATKAMTEIYGQIYKTAFGLETIGLRLFQRLWTKTRSQQRIRCSNPKIHQRITQWSTVHNQR